MRIPFSYAEKFKKQTLEYEIYQLNLQQHTHPASHKNSALRVSLLFTGEKQIYLIDQMREYKKTESAKLIFCSLLTQFKLHSHTVQNFV